MAKRVVETPVGAIAVRERGEGSPVLLVHGIPGSSRGWDAVAVPLVDDGHRVLAPDLLGFGDSDRPARFDALWADVQAQSLAHVLTELDVGPAIVVGHDYGVPTSVLLAARAPEAVAGLVLAAGNVFTDTPIPAPLAAVTWPLVGELVGRVALSTPMLRLLLRIGVGRPTVRLDAEAHLGDREQQAAIRTIFSGALRNLGERYVATETALPALRCPTAIVWGDRDPFFDLAEARRLAAAVPGADLRVEQGAGHFLPVERPGAFVEAVRLVSDAAGDATG